MSMSNFKAGDWVYVADSMGRLGQGYYKNRNNPAQTITVAEFERRRSQPVSIEEKNKEQKINIQKTPSPSPAQPQDLSPWDNPVIGEEQERVIQPLSKTETEGEKTAPAVQKVREKPDKQKPEDKKAQKKIPDGSGDGPETGAAAGSGGGGSAGAKIVCSELVRQGKMSEHDRRACTLYAFSRLPASFMTGYHFWAVPYVRLMRQSVLATRLIEPVVRCRTQEITYRLGYRGRGSWFGKLICAVHDPFCSLLGRFVEQKDYCALYREEEATV